ncbi:zinc-dependent metalloprotease [Coprobacter tertius]|uniref:Zinc-dependent metalloprotease n=1 Tax=Coprobacter tertius TaxID=2944915 RepID=A0ABT1MED6_9BACT|nr:zinc-dependent metalloprotease [Coprobacter tertius]MCP9610987.1 zinc-dependent metalloprotease [Coprobacter tertius]
MKAILTTLLLIAMLIPTQEAFGKTRSKSKKKTPAIEMKKDSVSSSSSAYKKAIAGAIKKEGLFTTFFTKENKLYFEIPDSAFKHTYLLSSRIAETSNTQDYVAGQMATRPFMIKFSKDNNNVYAHKVQANDIVSKGDPITPAFEKNFVDPVFKGFKIVGKNGDNVLIDVTSFFGSNEKIISPIKPENPLTVLLGGSKSLKGTFVSDGSTLMGVKTFPRNIEIRSMLSFNTTPLNQPYTVVVNRSLVLLPDEPMKMRLQDNRVGFFSSDKSLFTTSADKVLPVTFIHRWRVEPKPEDMDKYLKGELVEPQKQIVFYVDTAFPEKWRGVVKQGIEDWNRAFEGAGFKNVVVAKDYPRDDASFDPDDMRYSCVKYAVTSTANAMGPSFVDPRSGEILTADVIWYHNIISLLHNWRFTQTAAVDSRVRKPVFDNDVMCESMRYAAAHEIGHTLGLMHNMGASYSYPVDSLRSPSFTQQYGTTPSIMDYARNNFIAQPGDFEKGVKLTPPVLGVYDLFAIDWGYRLIPEAKTPADEKATLSAWIEEKKGDPMYEFGAQQFFATIDPTDQTEDLGNDHIKSGNYAISNLKIIMNNLEAWTLEKGATYENVETMYNEIVKQYSRHLRHVMPYIGGVKFTEIRQGEKGNAKDYFDKVSQKRAMIWLVEQARTYNDWLTPLPLMQKLNLDSDINNKLQNSVVACLLQPAALYRISEGEKTSKANYTLDGYLDDVTAELFKAAYKNQKLTPAEMNLQSTAIDAMISLTGLKTASAKKAALAFADYEELIHSADEPSVPCSHCGFSHNGEGSDSFMRINFGLPVLPAYVSAPMMTARLKKIETLYKQRAASAGDKATRDFYNYQLIKISQLFNK